jgi:hypothetical protein
LEQNNLTGNLDFLLALSKCRQLQILDVGSNSFTGVLPSYVGNLSTQLTMFLADNNMLIDGLPLAISNLSNIGLIDISDNLFAEPILESIVMLENLVYLDLSHNDMSGPIPTQMGMLMSLERLFLQANIFFRFHTKLIW